MKRREFIAGSTSLLTYAISSRAMAGKQWRIGEVFGGNPGQIFASALSQALLDLGYVNGKDIHLQTRFAAMLKEIPPDLSRVAVLGARGDPNVPFAIKSLETSAPSLGISLTLMETSSADDLPAAFDRMKQSQTQACQSARGPDADRHAKLLIHPPMEGSLFDAYSQHGPCVLLTLRTSAIHRVSTLRRLC